MNNAVLLKFYANGENRKVEYYRDGNSIVEECYLKPIVPLIVHVIDYLTSKKVTAKTEFEEDFPVGERNLVELIIGLYNVSVWPFPFETSAKKSQRNFNSPLL